MVWPTSSIFQLFIGGMGWPGSRALFSWRQISSFHANIYPGFFVPIPLWLLHKRYPHLGLNNINTAIIILYLCWLCVGINSSLMAFFFFGLISQAYIRKRYPTVFVKYNYLISAALDGGTSVIVFILSFAVAGAAGNAVNFRKSTTSAYPNNSARLLTHTTFSNLLGK